MVRNENQSRDAQSCGYTHKIGGTSETLVNNEADLNYKIHVCADRYASKLIPTDDITDVFIGVKRCKRTASFHI